MSALLYLIVLHDDLSAEAYQQLDRDSSSDPRFYENNTRLFLARVDRYSDDWLLTPIPTLMFVPSLTALPQTAHTII